jgi:cytochrome c-type biogenesis protein CcmF
MALARPAATVFFGLMLVAYGLLSWCFYVDDFSVLYVAQNSNTLLPVHFKLAAVWGGHEGSLLLWVLMLAGWTFAISWRSQALDLAMTSRVLAVLGLIAASLLLFVLCTSNPFDRLLPAADNGRDLNPLLQDPGLIFHPPLLYLGYVGFSVAYALAMASLISGQLDAAWVRWSRPWTASAWAFLTLGIALGSSWAYYELGWGGWWFWDPVENASLLPWLVGTALIHALAVTEKRGAFKSWTVLLAIGAFSLSLLGTFLVRSGVLTSVHAFATDPTRGVFILLLITLVVGSSLALFAWRAAQIRITGQFDLLSRETLILIGNVALVVACGTVLLGTLYPLLLDALGLGKISVGPPYFNAVFIPVMVPVMVLMAVAPWATWKHARPLELARKLQWVVPVALGIALGVPFAMGQFHGLTALGIFFAAWIATSGLIQVAQRLRSDVPPLSYWGMQLGHLGIAVFVAGVTLVGSYQQEQDVAMTPGDTLNMGRYTFRFEGVQATDGPNYKAMRGRFEVRTEGGSVTELHPEKRTYYSSSMPMTEAAINAGFTRDLYVSLGEPLEGEAWAVRVYVKPFVNWIWGGCILMAAGGMLSVADRRYRKHKTLLAQSDGAPA